MRHASLLVVCVALAHVGCTDTDPEEPESVEQGSAALSPSIGSEGEPNDELGQATPLSGSKGGLRAALFPTGDVDVYSFSASAGNYLYATTSTGGSVDGLDTTLRLLAPDGSLIEADDNDGSMTTEASALAVPISQSGIHYLVVSHPAQKRAMAAYDLYYMIATSTAAAEIEPNGTNAEAHVVHDGDQVTGARYLSNDQVDRFAIDVTAGDVLFVGADQRPSVVDATIQVTDPVGRVETFDAGSDHSQPIAGGAIYLARETGRYYVELTDQPLTTYRLGFAIIPSQRGTCHTYVATGLPLAFGPTSAASPITVPDDFEIGNVAISYSLTHANRKEVDLTIDGPGQGVVQDNVLLRYFDSGSTPSGGMLIDSSAPSSRGNVDGLPFLASSTAHQAHPWGRLSWFDGTRSVGDWTLRAWDRKPASSNGTLDAWSLQLCEPAPEPSCPVGTVSTEAYANSFETGSSGFKASGLTRNWAAAVGSCGDGALCYGSGYAPGSNGDFISPAISLAGLVPPIVVSWQQRYQLESARYDHASVEVFGGTPTHTLGLWEHVDDSMIVNVGSPPTILPEQTGWAVKRGRADSFSGQSIRMKFHFDSDRDVRFGGVWIDNVHITGCRAVGCGNGALDPGEDCDDGNTTDGDGCDANCTTTTCGNGVVTAGEACDDGNGTSGDGCSPSCQASLCGDGIVSSPEACDDGNGSSDDGCDNNCTASACGNGIRNSWEECDDGNVAAGDGCSPSCAAEPPRREQEPNDSLLEANLLTFGTGVFVDGDYISGEGPDIFAVPAEAGDRIYAAFRGNTAGGSVEILDPAGAVLASGSTDGAGGVEVGSPATYFVRVTPNIVPRYRVAVHRHSAPLLPDAEPNNTADEAQTIPSNAEIAGTLTQLSDPRDYFKVHFEEGERVSLIYDPTPPGSSGSATASVYVLTPDRVELTGRMSTFFVAPLSGDYILEIVKGPNGGAYRFSIVTSPPVYQPGHCKEYANSTPFGLADGATVNSTVTVPAADDGEITFVGVRLKSTDRAPGDLAFTLVAPAGNQITLADYYSPIDPFSSNETRGIDLDFDGDALLYAIFAADIDPVAHFAVQLKDRQSFTWFNDERSAGTWTLKVKDAVTVDIGTDPPAMSVWGWTLKICTRDPLPAIVCPPGSVYHIPLDANFNASNGLFSVTPGAQWARGVPSSAPITTCGGGGSCFKTNLSGIFSSGVEHTLRSPGVDLTNYVAPIRAHWKQKYHLDEGGKHQTAVMLEKPSVDRMLWQYREGDMGATSSAGWGSKHVDIEDGAGEVVHLAFTVSAAQNAIYRGWAVDDVMVEGCRLIICGDQFLDPPELCDDHNATDGDGCDTNCTPTACGNGIVTGTEDCDDGNLTNDDGCDSNCTLDGCGNGVVNAGEACDDGNLVDGDGCDSTCTPTGCGNGVVRGGEACDDGNLVDDDGCDSNCTVTSCGNGILTSGEDCDDGDLIDGNGCDSDCSMTSCGNGIVSQGEGCDDGNLNDADGCDSNCTPTACGNGILTAPEECDDGNLVQGDGCSATCATETIGNGGGGSSSSAGGEGGLAGTGGSGFGGFGTTATTSSVGGGGATGSGGLSGSGGSGGQAGTGGRPSGSGGAAGGVQGGAPGMGASSGSAGGGRTATSDDSGVGGAALGDGPAPEDGCGCVTAGRSDRSAWGSLLLLASLMRRARRRSRAREGERRP